MEAIKKSPEKHPELDKWKEDEKRKKEEHKVEAVCKSEGESSEKQAAGGAAMETEVTPKRPKAADSQMTPMGGEGSSYGRGMEFKTGPRFFVDSGFGSSYESVASFQRSGGMDESWAMPLHSTLRGSPLRRALKVPLCRLGASHLLDEDFDRVPEKKAPVQEEKDNEQKLLDKTVPPENKAPVEAEKDEEQQHGDDTVPPTPPSNAKIMKIWRRKKKDK